MSAAGVTFSEVMQGAFANGESEPVAGARRGRACGSALVFNVVARIPDTRRFVVDPQHLGELAGDVTYAPIGAQRAAAAGTFQLFLATADPALKLMSYQARFHVGPDEFFLDGAKHVRRRSVIHAWRDTTTLYCRLHAGASAQMPVIAAGVLRISAGAFARQLASFRTPGGATAAAKAGGLVRFFTFFSGEVVDTYLRP
jgi:hypothetical protein